MTTPPGHVSIVGAGPGDPGLLTVRAWHRLREADVVFADGLVPDAILALAPQARRVSVSRRSAHDVPPAAVAALIADAAALGQRVVRLRAGDPFVLARGAEEALALAEAGVPFEVVPGLSSALAAPSLASIPLTHRGLASAFVVVSGHAPASYAPVLRALPPDAVTVVVLMGLAQRAVIAETLLDAGWRHSTPAAVVVSAGWPEERHWYGTLGGLAEGEPPIDAADPGVIVIGGVVGLADLLDHARARRPAEPARFAQTAGAGRWARAPIGQE
jgi:uroporphyrin-III C-methyltransferase